MYRRCHLIRAAEQLLLTLFSEGLLSGTTHTCLGQEICQFAVARAFGGEHDHLLSNHRNHGHFLTYTDSPLGLIAEVMGRDTGICGGIGGSQHLALGHFHSNGVQAGMTAIGVGQALARRIEGQPGATGIVVGDGTLGEGLLYESLNLASVWRLPVVFVVEHNRIAQTTPTEQVIGGDIVARGAAFGLATCRISDDAPDFVAAVEAFVQSVRETAMPGFLVIDTERLGPHSKGDDKRSPDELAIIVRRDPLRALGRKLADSERQAIEAENAELIARVKEEALAAAPATRCMAARSILRPSRPHRCAAFADRPGSVREHLNAALAEMLRDEPRVVLLGEDLHDPYGGAFKVTAGLSTAYPDRVISTPISEAGIVGAGIGLGLSGCLPVVEIMFADFITLAMDQLFNHAVKFPGMFPDTEVPIVVRAPAGGGRGYGPTHSQCPENLLAAVPGLTVLSPSHRHPVGEMLKAAVLRWPNPTVFVEHKLLYARQASAGPYSALPAHPEDPGLELFPTMRRPSANEGASPDVSIVTYGGMVPIVEDVCEELQAEEIGIEIIAPGLVSPMPVHQLVDHLSAHSAVVVVEEAYGETGFGCALGAALLSAGFRGRFERVSMPPVPIPAARSLESVILPGRQHVLDAILRALGA